jgi:hypothetical protein
VIVVSVLIVAKASDTHSSTHLYYYISVFSSMHDRWNINCFTKCLDPSSE